MPKKGYTPEQIIHKLREAEVLLSQGNTIGTACKKIGISDFTYYRWRKEYLMRGLISSSLMGFTSNRTQPEYIFN